MGELREDQLLTIVKNVVEQNGCQLVEIDFENHVLNIDGPEDKQAACALALQDVLGS
jgi:phage tail tube protein FII